MLIRNLTADHVYLACGQTDMPEDLLEISEQQLRWLTEGLSISQPQAVQKVTSTYSF